MKKRYKTRLADPEKLQYEAVDGVVVTRTGRTVDKSDVSRTTYEYVRRYVFWAVYGPAYRAVGRAVSGEVVIK